MPATSHPFPGTQCKGVCVYVSVWPRLDPKRSLCLHGIPNTSSYPSFLPGPPLNFTLFTDRKTSWTCPSFLPSSLLFSPRCNFKLKVIEKEWNRFIRARKASECILWPQPNGCTLVCTGYSIGLHVLQNTVIRQTVKKSISCHHDSFWLTADSRRQAKVHSAL